MAIPSVPDGFVQITFDLNDAAGGSDTQVTHDAKLITGIFDYGPTADAIMTAVGTNAWWTANVQLEQVSIRVLNSDATGQSSLAPIPGGQGTSSVPINTAMLVRKRINLVGGRQQGRMFWPGISPGNVNFDGTIFSAVQTALQANIQQAYDDVVALAAVEELVTIQYNRAPNGNIIDYAGNRFVAGWDLQPKLATQRRRMRR